MTTNYRAYDEAVHADEPVPQSSEGNGFARLPRILRAFGAAILVAAVSIFLFQGWESGNDSYRYLLLLGHTVGLAVIGFLSGHVIRESKGARLLLALALASIPANFAILGGFVYSQFGATASMAYPAFVQWTTSSPTAAVGIVAIAVALLIPVMWLGFMVLTRRNAWRFSLMYLLTNVVILLPLREAHLIGWLALGLSLLVMLFNRKALVKDSALHTAEGITARTLQFLPLAVLVGRTLWLYSADVFLMTTMAAIVFFLMRHIAMLLDKEDVKRSFLEGLSVVPAIAVGFGTASLVSDYFHDTHVFLPVFSLAVGGLIMELGMRAASGGSMFRRIAASIVTLGILVNLMLFGGVLMAALCLALGLAVVIYGYMVEQRMVFAMGAVTLLTGLGYQLSYAIHFFALGSWGSLAALGVGAIVIGSLIERHGERIKSRVVQWGQRFRSWEY
jgi:hypothetical protein